MGCGEDVKQSVARFVSLQATCPPIPCNSPKTLREEDFPLRGTWWFPCWLEGGHTFSGISRTLLSGRLRGLTLKVVKSIEAGNDRGVNGGRPLAGGGLPV